MNQPKTLELKIPPPIVFLVFAGIIWLISAAFPFAHIAFPGKNMIAMGIVAAGGLFGGLSILSLLRARTTIHPEDPCKTTNLVVDGAYSITRNPMYLSLLQVLIAWAFYLSNLAAVIPIPFFVAYLNRFQIVPEEKALRSLFGSEYEVYRKRVRRWL